MTNVSRRARRFDLAALASPVLLPKQCGASYEPVEQMPAAMREVVLQLREADAGRFALRLYAEERGREPA